MKILALNGSPRKKTGNTSRILLPFLEGAKEAGAEVDLEYLQGKKIGPCLGCFKCWLETPGTCCQKDDQVALLNKLINCDVVVYATPLYVFGMTAQMKLFFDRVIPVAMPFIKPMADGHCTHPGRYQTGARSMVVISNCGFHELDNFDEMMVHFKAIARHTGQKLAGSLLRPHGEFLEIGEQLMPDQVKDVYDAAREAGRQLVTTGAVSKEIEDRVAKELISFDDFIEGANAYFKQELQKHGH